MGENVVTVTGSFDNNHPTASSSLRIEKPTNGEGDSSAYSSARILLVKEPFSLEPSFLDRFEKTCPPLALDLAIATLAIRTRTTPL